MNNPWLKVLVFSLLFGAVGFLLGRQCSASCGRDGGHCGRSAACHGGNGCGGQCEGKCDGSCEGQCSGDKKACCKSMGHGSAEAEAQAAVDRIKASGFQGDTTVQITGGHVSIHKQGDELEVRIEISDTTRKEATERTVEVHTH